MSEGTVIGSDYEKNEELVDTIRFLIKDNAFDVEFLITSVLDYAEANNKYE